MECGQGAAQPSPAEVSSRKRGRACKDPHWPFTPAAWTPLGALVRTGVNSCLEGRGKKRSRGNESGCAHGARTRSPRGARGGHTHLGLVSANGGMSLSHERSEAARGLRCGRTLNRAECKKPGCLCEACGAGRGRKWRGAARGWGGGMRVLGQLGGLNSGRRSRAVLEAGSPRPRRQQTRSPARPPLPTSAHGPSAPHAGSQRWCPSVLTDTGPVTSGPQRPQLALIPPKRVRFQL